LEGGGAGIGGGRSGNIAQTLMWDLFLRAQKDESPHLTELHQHTGNSTRHQGEGAEIRGVWGLGGILCHPISEVSGVRQPITQTK